MSEDKNALDQRIDDLKTVFCMVKDIIESFAEDFKLQAPTNDKWKPIAMEIHRLATEYQAKQNNGYIRDKK